MGMLLSRHRDRNTPAPAEVEVSPVAPENGAAEPNEPAVEAEAETKSKRKRGE